MPADAPTRTVGQIVDALAVKPDGIDEGDLFSDAIVIMKCVTADGNLTLWTGDSGVDWITKIGMMRAATTIEEPSGYGVVDHDDED